jgi:hypothetical protein
MTVRRRIETAAKAAGFDVLSLTYTPPVALEMGDGIGGWLLRTQYRVFGGTADYIIEEMQEYMQTTTGR